MTNAESFLPTLSAVAAVYLIAVASPGSNFFILSQLSLSDRRAPGVWVAFGITLGSTIWAVLSMAGVASLLASFGWIYTTIRLLGATYLIWFGGQLLWSSINGTPAGQLRFATLPSARKAFRTGVITSLTNPKSGAFWTSVFASIFSSERPVLVVSSHGTDDRSDFLALAYRYCVSICVSPRADWLPEA
jgi:threonine/homoserine/homoserine lactone efflux protein